MPEPIALITGATSGIGRAAAAHLASSGWAVWVAGRSLDRAKATAAEIGGRPLQLDVTEPDSVAAAVAVVTELDALINNAGISTDSAVPITEADAELFRQTYETNVFGVVTVTNGFLSALRQSDHPRIVNVSSGTGSLTWSTGANPQFDYQQAAQSGGRLAAYRSSKTALNAVTLFYAQALEPERFKVNALAPGLRATNLNPRAATHGEDPAPAAAAIANLAEIPDDGPTGRLFSYDGSIAPW
jgi:NAD(P)-dependent dehydrogenase (short-subunit alcohol dehydrogenase family)